MGWQSTGRVRADICTDGVTAPGVLVMRYVGMLVPTEVLTLLLTAQPASASGNTMLLLAGGLVTSQPSAVSTLSELLTPVIMHFELLEYYTTPLNKDKNEYFVFDIDYWHCGYITRVQSIAREY